MGRYGSNGADTGKRYGDHGKGARDTATARARETAGYVRTARETARLGVYGDGGRMATEIAAGQSGGDGNGQVRGSTAGAYIRNPSRRAAHRAYTATASIFGGHTSARTTG